MKKNFIIKNLLYILQGILIGGGAILPGVSGGVLCLVFGIYEPMMDLLTNPIKGIKTYYKMLIPVGIGWAAGFFLFAVAVEQLFIISETVALVLFFGLICGTLPQLFKSSEISDHKKSWTPFVLSLAIGYFALRLMNQGGTIDLDTNIWLSFLCGGIWGLSLIIPGLSSSSLLMYLGIYTDLMTAVKELDLLVGIPMMLGIVITAVALARPVKKLFKTQYTVVSRIVLGFVFATSLNMLPAEFAGIWELVISLACFAAGFAVALGMDKAQAKQNT